VCRHDAPVSADEREVDIAARLAAATPTERGDIMRELVAANPDERLEFPSRAGDRLNLQGAKLSGVSLRRANFAGADFRGANLAGAALGQVNFTGAILEEANLRDADLAGAILHGAALGEADLRGALLEEADLQGAGLRFANLSGAALEGANLRQADLWGADLTGIDCTGADLTDAQLGESTAHNADFSHANLRGVAFSVADLTGVRFTGADLRGAAFGGAILRDARLDNAQLQNVDLSTCDITHAAFAGAVMDKTHFDMEQLGGAIGEEHAGTYGTAVKGYVALERNFTDLGHADAARWAYGKRRRMQKFEARAQGRAALGARQWRDAAHGYAVYIGDQFVEWLCDYGESVPRVLFALVVTYLAFTLLYGVTGSVVRTTNGVAAVTRDPLYVAIFSLVEMVTQTPLNMQPRSEVVQIAIGIQCLTSIFLSGLLGFVAGNRIRR